MNLIKEEPMKPLIIATVLERESWGCWPTTSSLRIVAANPENWEASGPAMSTSVLSPGNPAESPL